MLDCSLDEDEDGEAHSAADEAWHWPKPVQHIGQELGDRVTELN